MLGVVFYAALVSLTIISSYPSPYSSELIGGGWGFGSLPTGFCYVCVCIGMAHLFSVGERTGVCTVSGVCLRFSLSELVGN